MRKQDSDNALMHAQKYSFSLKQYINNNVNLNFPSFPYYQLFKTNFENKTRVGTNLNKIKHLTSLRKDKNTMPLQY